MRLRCTFLFKLFKFSGLPQCIWLCNLYAQMLEHAPRRETCKLRAAGLDCNACLFRARVIRSLSRPAQEYGSEKPGLLVTERYSRLSTQFEDNRQVKVACSDRWHHELPYWAPPSAFDCRDHSNSRRVTQHADVLQQHGLLHAALECGVQEDASECFAGGGGPRRAGRST